MSQTFWLNPFLNDGPTDVTPIPVIFESNIPKFQGFESLYIQEEPNTPFCLSPIYGALPGILVKATFAGWVSNV